MSLEKICVSLEMAERLHEAGIMIESVFSWVKISWDTGCMENFELMSCNDLIPYQLEEGYKIESYPAPAAEEIELPSHITTYQCGCEDCKGQYQCFNIIIRHTTTNPKMSEARAEMLLWLTENGYLKGDRNEPKSHTKESEKRI
jgi:hypothetical protein